MYAEKFPDRLRELRMSKDMTQKVFAETVELTPASQSAYEGGRKTPTIEIAARIAAKHDVSLDWLCGLSEAQSIEGMKTYADVARCIANACAATTVEIDVDARYHTVTDEYNDYIECNSIYFMDDYLSKFFEGLKSMSNLLRQRLIEKRVYDLWLEDTLKSLDETFEEVAARIKPFIPVDDDDLPF